MCGLVPTNNFAGVRQDGTSQASIGLGKLEETKPCGQKLGCGAKSPSAWALNCKCGLEREVLPGTDLRLHVRGSAKLLCGPRGLGRSKDVGRYGGVWQ